MCTIFGICATFIEHFQYFLEFPGKNGVFADLGSFFSGFTEIYASLQNRGICISPRYCVGSATCRIFDELRPKIITKEMGLNGILVERPIRS